MHAIIWNPFISNSNFQLQNLFPTENFCRPSTLLQNFLSAENFLSANGKEMGFTSSSWLIFQCFRSVAVARKNVGISGFFTESWDILETSLGFLQILQWALGHRIRYTEGWLLGFYYDFPMILSSNADSMVLASEHLRGIHPDIIQNGGLHMSFLWNDNMREKP